MSEWKTPLFSTNQNLGIFLEHHFDDNNNYDIIIHALFVTSILSIPSKFTWYQSSHVPHSQELPDLRGIKPTLKEQGERRLKVTNNDASLTLKSQGPMRDKMKSH